MGSPLSAVLNRFPRLKQLLKFILHKLIVRSSVSSHYFQIHGREVDMEFSRLRASWKALDLPAKQRKLVDTQLAAFRRGKSVDVFDVMARALRTLPSNANNFSVLEVGCSSGFYSEVFEIAGLNVHYTGCDYSDAFIELARKKYPAQTFDVEDATALRYDNETFDVVISGCCLLHIPDYEAAVCETARVARNYAIFHRTPVVFGQGNVYYRKQAYGVETLEIHFNESQFLELLASNGLEPIATYTLSEFVQQGIGSATRTYVCKKPL